MSGITKTHFPTVINFLLFFCCAMKSKKIITKETITHMLDKST